MSLNYRDYLDQLRTHVAEVSPDETWQALQSGAAIIDVREATEFVDGVIEGAALVPRGILETFVEETWPDRETPLILYCAVGGRSLLAAASLQAMGYQQVRSMAEGFRGWKNQGLPFSVPDLLSDEEQSRYSRQIRIPEVGTEGQKKLQKARVLLIGAGGLGAPAATYLAAAGVGTLGIIDSDQVDRSNLHRQIIHTTDSIGTPKVDSARRALQALNPSTQVLTWYERLTASKVQDILQGFDLVLDGGDNFATRYLVNDACVHLGIPNVSGSISRFEGQLMVVQPHQGPCYRCLYPEPPPPELAPSCQESGVLGVLPGVIGLLQATEVLKLLLGIGEPLVGRVLLYDALTLRFRELRLTRDPDCPTCGDHAEFRGFDDMGASCR